jgi:hypothetical protein
VTILARGRSWQIEDVAGQPARRVFTTAAHDLNYHDGTTWQPVNENFVAETGTFAHQCTTLRHAIHIGSTGTRRWYPRRDKAEYVEFGRLQSWSGTAWGNVTLGTPVRTANKITWTSTAFGLSLTNDWHKIKLEATLKTEAARRRLRWAVTLSGLTYNAGDLVSIADGIVVGHVDAPVAWDATGSIDNPNVTITTTYAAGYIEFGGNLAGAVLPITIDPTLTDGYGGDVTTYCDTYLRSSAGDTNYATDAIWRHSTAYTPLIQFDVSTIPDTATIDSATLYLYKNASGGINHTGYLYPILSANSGWTEAGATWNHTDGTGHWAGDAASDGGSDAGCTVSGTDYDATAAGSVSYVGADAADTEYAISIGTATVTAWLTANYGLVLHAGDNTEIFRSSDYTTDATKRPKLVVNYTEAGGTSTPMTLTGESTPSGTLARVLNLARTYTGGSTPSGTLARVMNFTRTLAGGTTPTGTLAKVFNAARTFTGGSTPSGTLTRVLNLARTFTGESTPSGALAYLKAIVRTFTGTSTPTGTLARALTLVRTFTGGSTPTGALSQIFNQAIPAPAEIGGGAAWYNPTARASTKRKLEEEALILLAAVAAMIKRARNHG